MNIQWTFDLSDNAPVFVERQGQWHEARLTGANGSWDTARQQQVELYTVTYSDPTVAPAETVDVSRIRPMTDPFIQDLMARGVLLRKVYDVATSAGINEMVAAHNRWRAAVGVPPVVWDAQLAQAAQPWADRLLRLKVLQHTTHQQRNNTGENLFWSSNPYTTPTEVVDSWGSEKHYYNYQQNTCAAGQMCGHYTQIVWRATQRIGAAVAKDKFNAYWVCRYSPPGNFVGQRPY